MNNSIIRVRCCDMCGQSPCVNPSFCRLCRVEARKPRPRRNPLYEHFNKTRPTPQTTVEAILHCVRERGVAALKEPANIERLSRCDAAAKAQIDGRIKKLIDRKAVII
jgi:hypothetical protein